MKFVWCEITKSAFKCLSIKFYYNYKYRKNIYKEYKKVKYSKKFYNILVDITLDYYFIMSMGISWIKVSKFSKAIN